MIRLENVTRTYAMGGGMTVLRQVSLHIARGESACIIGPSGSGKSTMLNILGLLDRPTKGTYYFEGQDTGTLTDAQLSHLRGRRIGFVFQSFHLIPHLSVVENVELPLFYQRIPPTERRRRAEEKLEKVRLSHRLHHRANQLSGGECQRTAIARALITDAELLLADEPTGNLDQRTGAEILSLFDELSGTGKTLIVITHDMKVAARYPRRIHIADGLVSGDGL